jgi:two-component sensor histidine kinase
MTALPPLLYWEWVALLVKATEQIALCLERAAEADARAEATNDAEYRRIADGWRTLARSYEFQGSLGRFISFSKSKGKAIALVPVVQSPSVAPERKIDFLDWLAGVSERIRPYSAAAFGIAVASLAIATLLRFVGGWASSDLRFAIYLPAILATGLLAGVSAALSVAVASILIITWAFMPPYFEWKWPSETEQINIFFNAVPYLITVYFAYLCRVVLQRLRRGELNNQILVKELQHRGRNIFSVIDVIIQKTLAHDPESVRTISGRLRSIRYANELLTGKARSVTIKDLLLEEFAAYGENRLQLQGPDFDIGPESARHLALLFHELATNAAKYGALSRLDGKIFVDWHGNSIKLYLTWKEYGGPKIRPLPSNQGFGSQLIDVSVKSLSGIIQQNFHPDGFTCSMKLRLRK